MNRRGTSRVVILGILVGSAGLATFGCVAENPSATVSPPSVYTSSHIAAVPDALARSSFGIDPSMAAMPFATESDELARYFRQKVSDDEGGEVKLKYLRMDTMLDQEQRASSLAQLLAVRLAIRSNINAGSPRAISGDQTSQQREDIASKSQGNARQGDAAAPSAGQSVGSDKVASDANAQTQPSSTKTADDKKDTAAGSTSPRPLSDANKKDDGQQQTSESESQDSVAGQIGNLPNLASNDIKLLQLIAEQAAADSPFDRLDRAADFYTAYLLKVLPRVGYDSRLMDSNMLANAAQRGSRVRGSLSRSDAVDVANLYRTRIAERDKLTQNMYEMYAKRDGLNMKMQIVINKRNATQKQHDELMQKLAEANAKMAGSKRDAKPSATDDENRSQDAATNAQSVIELEKEFGQISDDLALADVELASATHERTLHDNSVRLMQDQQKAIESEIQNLLVQLPPGDEGYLTPEHMAELSKIDADRLLLLTFQTHVHPGTRANMMTGARVRIVSTESGSLDQEGKPLPSSPRWQGLSGAQLVQVVRLHPTRSYDVESQVFIELINDAFQAAVSASGQVTPGVQASGSLEAERREQSEERRRFLSRLTKTASFADAGNNEFGWNFYPTNLAVSKTTAIERLLDWKQGRFKVDAYLEGGARDCAAWLVVPKNLKSITFEVSHVVASVDPAQLNQSESRWIWAENGRRLQISNGVENPRQRFTVVLPPWNPREAVAFFSSGEQSPAKAADQSGTKSDSPPTTP